jgi:HAD superfamily hydrolase (TIGR01490 family)
MIVAIFDADGTLYSAQYGRGLMTYARTHGHSGRARLYFASIAWLMALTSVGLADGEALDRAKISGLARMMRGWSESQARPALTWVTDQYLLATRREHVIRRLQAHQSQGHVVVIASGTFLPSLQLLGERLGVKEFVGTRIEVAQDRYTGRIVPPIIKGADKAEQVKAHLLARNLDVDWDASYAYGDSYSDHLFMTLVGHPVAVHPDPKLRAMALARNWEVLDSSPAPPRPGL